MAALTAFRALRPLRHRDYRLLWLALAVTLVGDGVWLVAIPWQVITVGAGPGALALVMGAGSVGILLSLFAGGLLADLLPRRTVLSLSAFAAAAVVLVLVLLGLGDRLSTPAMAVAAFLLAALEGVNGPSVETLIPTLVPEPELQAAYGLEELLSSVAMRAVGPAVGGVAVALVGPVGALALDAASFLLAGLLLLLVRGGRSAALAAPGSLGLRAAARHFREGAVFVARNAWLWTGIGWASLALLAQIGPRQVLLPFLVVRELAGDASDLGLLLAVYGICATAGALVAASLPTPERYLTAMFAAWTLGSLPFAVLPFTGRVPLAAVALGAAGLFASIGNVFWSTLMQRRVPAELRGRVASFDWFGTRALIPVSMAVAGALGSSPASTTTAFVVAGLGPAALAMVATLAAGLRRDEVRHPSAAPAGPGGSGRD